MKRIETRELVVEEKHVKVVFTSYDSAKAPLARVIIGPVMEVKSPREFYLTVDEIRAMILVLTEVIS